MSSKHIKKRIVLFETSANIMYNFTHGVLSNVSLPTHFIYENMSFYTYTLCKWQAASD